MKTNQHTAKAKYWGGARLVRHRVYKDGNVWRYEVLDELKRGMISDKFATRELARRALQAIYDREE